MPTEEARDYEREIQELKREAFSYKNVAQETRDCFEKANVILNYQLVIYKETVKELEDKIRGYNDLLRTIKKILGREYEVSEYVTETVSNRGKLESIKEEIGEYEKRRNCQGKDGSGRRN